MAGRSVLDGMAGAISEAIGGYSDDADPACYEAAEGMAEAYRDIYGGSLLDIKAKTHWDPKDGDDWDFGYVLASNALGDRIGRIYAAPQFQVAIKGEYLEWGTVGPARRNPAPKSAYEELERMAEEFHSRRARLASKLVDVDAAIVTSTAGRRWLVIFSGETAHPEEGAFRASYFDEDGPYGHVTRRSRDELAKELVEELSAGNVIAVGEAEVMAWTSTERFREGSERVAAVQAENAKRWRGNPAVYKTIRAADARPGMHYRDSPFYDGTTKIVGWSQDGRVHPVTIRLEDGRELFFRYNAEIQVLDESARRNPVGDRVEAVRGPARGLRGVVRAETERVAQVDFEDGSRAHVERGALRTRRPGGR